MSSTNLEKVVRKYQRGIRRHGDDDPRRYQWHGYDAIEMREIWSDIVSLLPTDRQLRVLEVGCGGGELASLIRERRPLVTYSGIDIVPENIRLASQREPVRFLCATLSVCVRQD